MKTKGVRFFKAIAAIFLNTIIILSSTTVLSKDSEPNIIEIDNAKTEKPGKKILFIKNTLVEIPSISATVGQGQAIFGKSKNNKYALKMSVHIKFKKKDVKVVDGKWCSLCAKTIKMEPGVVIPVTFFQDKSSYKQSYVHNQYVVESVDINIESESKHSAPPDYDASIFSGSEGVILEKKGAGFILKEGDAYFLQK